MPPLLFWTIYLLIRTLGSVDARAVDTTIPPLPTSTDSFVIADPPNATASQRCGDIDNCRTLNQIVVSCLTTIIACVWFAVHPNIPAPARKPSDDRGVFVRTAQRAWYFVLDQREPAFVCVVAVLAPEWILAWALRQALHARRLTGELEEARVKAIEVQNGKRPTVSYSEKGVGGIAARAEGDWSLDGPAAVHEDSEGAQLTNRRANTSQPDAACETCGRGCQCGLVAAVERVEETDQRWGMSHGFFVAMGGFQLCTKQGLALYPLSPNVVVKLVELGHLVPPTAEEISDKSKGDALSKGVAIIQTLWFVMQCIARRAEGLPVTNLEVMTLAYTVMTVAMYITWWHKPLNVSCAVRLLKEEKDDIEAFIKEDAGDPDDDSVWERIMFYVMGAQDPFVDLRQCKRVPIFWAGNADDSDTVIADAIALLVAMAFGAVHCIAWHSEFQSDLELQLWRYSAIAIIAVPVALVAVLLGLGAALIAGCFQIEDSADMFKPIGILYTPIAIIYIAARGILIVLSFTSLKGLPVGAYQTIQWTTFIPHI